MTLIDIIKNGYFQQVRFLVDYGCNLDQKDEEKRTALMLCAFVEPEAWGVGICRLLIENGATLDYKDKYGLNAFHYAVIYERVELVRVFLNAIDFDLKESDKKGNTALHYAVKAGNSLVTRLIVQAFLKYKVKLDKQNNDGFTALQEANRLTQRKCAIVIENAEELADSSTLKANLPLDLKSGDFETDSMSIRSSRKTSSRPRSSMFSRRSSKSSFVTSEYFFRRTPTIMGYDQERSYRRRDTPAEIPPYEKNKKNLIRCVSMSDFRNNPEYLFHMTPIEATADMSPPKRQMRAKSAFVRRSEIENDPDRDGIALRANWRTEFRKLYVHFQYQCTPSYRDTVQLIYNHDASLPSLEKPITPASSEHALAEDVPKKSRIKSAAPSRQNTDDNLLGKSRIAIKSNSRKLSQNVGHGTGKMSGSVDGSLESSSESINSSVSSKKQSDGKNSKPPSGKEQTAGRQSRSSSHKQAPSLNIDETQSVSRVVDPGNQDASRLKVIDE